jgi:acetoin utilization protein AcuB
MRVGDCMTQNPEYLAPNATMREAVMLLQRRHIRHLPVVEDGTLVGIVTDRDIRRASPSLLSGISQSDYDEVLESTQLSRIMTRQPLTLTPETEVGDAVRLLVEKRVGGLPVVREGRLVGIFTSSDALKVLLHVLARVPS